jgi:hypothetical protein
MKYGFLTGGLAFAMGLLLFVHRLETGGDNLDFLLQARSAMEGNWADVFSWYRPPAYALLIAGLLTGAGIDLPVGPLQVPSYVFYGIGVIGVLSFALTAVAVHRWAKAVASSSCMALGIALLFALNQTLAAWSSVVAAETLLSLLVFAGLAAWERAEAGEGRTRARLAAFAVFVSVAIFVRSVALAVVAAVGLWMLVRRRFSLQYIATAAAIGLAALAAVLQIALRSKYYITHIVASDPYGFGEHVGWTQRLSNAAGTYLQGWPDLLFPKVVGYRGILEITQLTALGPVLTAVVLFLSVAGFISTVRRRGWLLSHLYLLTYMVMLFVWPDFLTRYMFPLVPVGLWLVFEGVQALASRFTALRSRALPVCMGLAVAWALATNVFAGFKNWRTIARIGAEPIWAPERYDAAGEVDFGDYMTAALWLRDNAPTNALIFCRKAHYVELASGRSALNYSSYAEPDDVWRAAQSAATERASFILQDRFGGASTYGKIRALRLDPAIQDNQDALDPVHTTAGGSVIYRVR